MAIRDLTLPSLAAYLVLACVAAVAAAVGAAVAERGPALPDYPAEEVASGVFVIHGPLDYPNPDNQGFMNNPAFIVTDAGVIVVDPGASVQSGEMVLRQLREVTDKPLIAVLNTHVHGDHWLGNQAMRAEAPGVPIYGHPNMIAAIEDGAGTEWIDRMLRATEGATKGTEAVAPNKAVDDGDELSIGGLTFRIHHFGHQHTHTDLMISVPERSLLFLADNANNGRIVRMDDGSFTGLIAGLERLRDEVEADVLIPGHGRTGGWEIVDENLDYLRTLHGGVAELYDAGMSDFEMKPELAERLSAFSDWPGFDEELGKHISLAYLEVEADAF
jgi:glyoxylase-like metal-dependent hydrolase (beta-lactamase superfamily II)